MRQLMEDPNRPLTPAPARASTPPPATTAPANLDPDFIRQAIQDAIGAFPVIKFSLFSFRILRRIFLFYLTYLSCLIIILTLNQTFLLISLNQGIMDTPNQAAPVQGFRPVPDIPALTVIIPLKFYF